MRTTRLLNVTRSAKYKKKWVKYKHNNLHIWKTYTFHIAKI